MPVDAGSNVREDVHLEVGNATQAVEVQAEAVALQTDNARSQTVITDKLIHDLPTVVGGNLRSPFDLAILTPESKNFGDNNFQIGGRPGRQLRRQPRRHFGEYDARAQQLLGGDEHSLDRGPDRVHR